ncbi:MAG: tetratricopeptide repeat protein [Verrucomicrobia bacterium]|nr:tetratricopeptide repeat protein [Verrucomicrobiota bacterium]
MICGMPGPFHKPVCLTLLVLLNLAANFSAWAQTGQSNEAEGLAKKLTELRQQNKYTEAVPVARHILDLVEKANGPSHTKTAFAVNDLATLYQIIGDYPRAEPLFQRSLRICELAFGRCDERLREG